VTTKAMAIGKERRKRNIRKRIRGNQIERVVGEIGMIVEGTDMILHPTKRGEAKRSDENIRIVREEVEVRARDLILHQVKVHRVYHPMTAVIGRGDESGGNTIRMRDLRRSRIVHLHDQKIKEEAGASLHEF
jgi:hypothetical protein